MKHSEGDSRLSKSLRILANAFGRDLPRQSSRQEEIEVIEGIAEEEVAKHRE
jgi:hypothetical protein